MLRTVLVLQGKELLYWIFHFLLVTEALRTQEVSHGLEKVIIRGTKAWIFMLHVE